MTMTPAERRAAEADWTRQAWRRERQDAQVRADAQARADILALAATDAPFPGSHPGPHEIRQLAPAPGVSRPPRPTDPGRTPFDASRDMSPRETVASASPTADAANLSERDDRRCMCGHTAHWHSHDGQGSCEHDGDCECSAFQWSSEVIASAMDRAFGTPSERVCTRCSRPLLGRLGPGLCDSCGDRLADLRQEHDRGELSIEEAE